MTGGSERRKALVVRMVGDPDRVTDEALSTLAEMTRAVESMPGFAGARMLVTDRASATLMVMFLFSSDEFLGAAQDRSKTAIEVAAVVMGGDPARATVEWFDVVEASFERS